MMRYPFKSVRKVRDYDYDLKRHVVGNMIVVSNFRTKSYYSRPMTLREFAITHKDK